MIKPPSPYGWKVCNLNVGGLRCDTPGCGWRDPNARWNDTSLINKACPQCGANVYTPEDYRTVKVARRVYFIINVALLPTWPLRILFNAYLQLRGKPVWLRSKANMNGTGAMNFSPFQPVEDDQCK